MDKLLIMYCPSDGPDVATIISKQLQQRFGYGHIVQDGSTKILTNILRAIAAHDRWHVLLLIGHRWSLPHYRPEVEREIQERLFAFDAASKLVWPRMRLYPIALGCSQYPSLRYKSLNERHGLVLRRDSNFAYDIEKLVLQMQKAIQLVGYTITLARRSWHTQRVTICGRVRASSKTHIVIERDAGKLVELKSNLWTINGAHVAAINPLVDDNLVSERVRIEMPHWRYNGSEGTITDVVSRLTWTGSDNIGLRVNVAIHSVVQPLLLRPRCCRLLHKPWIAGCNQ